uniref:Sulfhydryl oxidase n=1 Tax=Anisakis simplex TaxID=6269 RepID=A0A0M3K852_ANISI
LYFVSETDMLKAMRMALMDEVMKSGKVISNENFTALYNFIGVLSEHFPTYSFSNNLQRQHRSRRSQSVLRMSTRARHVFIHMREFLNKHLPQMQVNASDWQQHFVNMERVFGNPFPTNASWVHCKGTRPQYRGYTCGLWTTFHALTVNAYMNSLERELQPLQILSSIKQWVDSFFGCLHCRQHFDRMTTKIFPMTERWIRQPSDMMMYLWRAHNIVNQRLHNDPTEDPQFEKYQFPAPFLCQSCQIGSDHFSKKEVHRFLMRFYGNIRAYQPDAQT